MSVCGQLAVEQRQLERLQAAYYEHLRLGHKRLGWLERIIESQRETMKPLIFEFWKQRACGGCPVWDSCQCKALVGRSKVL